jgi:ELWxxDGT repeat protein
LQPPSAGELLQRNPTLKKTNIFGYYGSAFSYLSSMIKTSPIPRLVVVILLVLVSASSFPQAVRIASFNRDQFGGPSEAISFNGKLFFSAYDPQYGRELWCTDGTKAGTFLVYDIYPGSGSGLSDNWELTATVFNGHLYFCAEDTFHGKEIWRTDGTSSGTALFSDLYPGNASSNIGQFTVVDSLMYFTTYISSSILWRTNGTPQGTYSLKSFMIATNLTAWNGRLYFAADDNNNGQELWRSNGTSGGTFLLKDLNGAVGASLPCNFHATPSALYFMANTASGWELWKTNGTNSGTQQVVDINPGPANGVMNAYGTAAMANLGDTLFFRARNNSGIYQLFLTDGTAAGTLQLTNHPTGLDEDGFIPVSNGKVYVAGFTDSLWWEWDAVAGTGAYSDYPVSYQLYNWPKRYLFDDGMYYFCGNDTLFGQEICSSDGTAGGVKILQETHLLNNWSSAGSLGFNKFLGKSGDRLVFSLARDRYTTSIPLFSWNVADTTTLHPPVVSVAVPLSAGALHLVWNRVRQADDYQLRYKTVADTAWTLITSSATYRLLNNLDTTQVYMVQFRSRKNSTPSAWSDTTLYDFTYITNDFDLDMLAEREEDSTSVRLYWMISSAFSQVQFRYNEFGTTNYQTVSGSTGYKKITGLQPGTLYEYTYRISSGGGWGPWFPGAFYFATTGTPVISGLTDATQAPVSIHLAPNPVRDVIKWTGWEKPPYVYRVLSIEGKMMDQGLLSSDQLDVAHLPPGIYILLLETDTMKATGRFVRE